MAQSPVTINAPAPPKIAAPTGPMNRATTPLSMVLARDDLKEKFAVEDPQVRPGGCQSTEDSLTLVAHDSAVPVRVPPSLQQRATGTFVESLAEHFRRHGAPHDPNSHHRSHTFKFPGGPPLHTARRVR